MSNTAKAGIYGLDKSKLPVRVGKPWKDDEVLQLLKSIQKKKSVQEIAKEHERTEGGIRAHLRQIAADYHFNDNRPIEEIQKYTGLTKEEILDTIQRRTWQMNTKERRQTQGVPLKQDEDVPIVTQVSDTQQIIELLKDIQSKLSSLLDKVN